MNRSTSIAFAVSAFTAIAFANGASSQDLGALKDAAGGGLDVSSLASGSAGNAAGIIEYCMKNNFLGGGASGVKDQLIGKLGGEEKAQEDPGYLEGAMETLLLRLAYDSRENLAAFVRESIARSKVNG